ncbi:MAG: flagellar biosynthesis anti-sigma factor FlgM [Gammaproteobacteria bacterium]|nr:flagellar biosynthesis anti-sigma factor FlgM [Gammaproteobacteria bacterium]
MTNSGPRHSKPSSRSGFSRPGKKGGKESTGHIARFPVKDLKNENKSTLTEAELDALRRKLQDLETELKQLPEINASKIVGLHHRIEDGDYAMDPERIAEKLAKLEAELNRK